MAPKKKPAKKPPALKQQTDKTDQPGDLSEEPLPRLSENEEATTFSIRVAEVQGVSSEATSKQVPLRESTDLRESGLCGVRGSWGGRSSVFVGQGRERTLQSDIFLFSGLNILAVFWIGVGIAVLAAVLSSTPFRLQDQKIIESSREEEFLHDEPSDVGAPTDSATKGEEVLSVSFDALSDRLKHEILVSVDRRLAAMNSEYKMIGESDYYILSHSPLANAAIDCSVPELRPWMKICSLYNLFHRQIDVFVRQAVHPLARQVHHLYSVLESKSVKMISRSCLPVSGSGEVTIQFAPSVEVKEMEIDVSDLSSEQAKMAISGFVINGIQREELLINSEHHMDQSKLKIGIAQKIDKIRIKVLSNRGHKRYTCIGRIIFRQSPTPTLALADAFQ